MQQVNVEGTKNIVDACKKFGVERLIYTSSLEVAIGKLMFCYCLKFLFGGFVGGLMGWRVSWMSGWFVGCLVAVWFSEFVGTR